MFCRFVFQGAGGKRTPNKQSITTKGRTTNGGKRPKLGRGPPREGSMMVSQLKVRHTTIQRHQILLHRNFHHDQANVRAVPRSNLVLQEINQGLSQDITQGRCNNHRVVLHHGKYVRYNLQARSKLCPTYTSLQHHAIRASHRRRRRRRRHVLGSLRRCQRGGFDTTGVHSFPLGDCLSSRGVRGVGGFRCGDVAGLMGERVWTLMLVVE